MSMFKKTKVVMLPTNEKATMALNGNKLSLKTKALQEESQHLYFLSDEEIEDGEYGFCMNLFNQGNQPYQIIFKMDSEQRQAMIELGGQKNANVFKIIATTDTSLRLTEIVKEDDSIEFPYITSLPQPSQSFIEKFVEEYNKGNVITEVMVEYEVDDGYMEVKSYLKVNSKDNTITIRKAKDSWSTEEMRQKLNDYRMYAKNSNLSIEMFDKWIEENL